MSDNIENLKIIALQKKLIEDQNSEISVLEQEVALLNFELNSVHAPVHKVHEYSASI